MNTLASFPFALAAILSAFALGMRLQKSISERKCRIENARMDDAYRGALCGLKDKHALEMHKLGYTSAANCMQAFRRGKRLGVAAGVAMVNTQREECILWN